MRYFTFQFFILATVKAYDIIIEITNEFRETKISRTLDDGTNDNFDFKKSKNVKVSLGTASNTKIYCTKKEKWIKLIIHNFTGICKFKVENGEALSEAVFDSKIYKEIKIEFEVFIDPSVVLTMPEKKLDIDILGILSGSVVEYCKDSKNDYNALEDPLQAIFLFGLKPDVQLLYITSKEGTFLSEYFLQNLQLYLNSKKFLAGTSTEKIKET